MSRLDPMTQTRIDESGGETVVCEQITVEEVVSGDVFPSHDGFEHIVTWAGLIDGQTLLCVEKSNGDRYSTDLNPTDEIWVVS